MTKVPQITPLKRVANFILIGIGLFLVFAGNTAVLPHSLFGIGVALIAFGIFNFGNLVFWKKAGISVLIGIVVYFAFKWLIGFQRI